MLEATLAPFDPASLPSRLAYEFRPIRPRVPSRDLHDLFSFLWARDSEHFEHPRYRLQTALVLQLFYHLGLHPMVALSEGLHYQDTQILLKKHNNVVRFVLVIHLHGRDNFAKSPKHWRGHV